MKRPVAIVLTIAAGLVLVAGGVAIGRASTQSKIDALTAQRDTRQELLDSNDERVRVAKANAATDKRNAATDKRNAAIVEKNKADAAAKVVADKLAADRTAAILAAEQAAQKDHITTDGVYAVGVDKTAGRWKTAGVPTNCYWSITTDPNGGNIVENNFGPGTAYVDVQAGQFLKVQNCGAWDRI